MSHLTESMVEQFIEVEKENARGVLRKEMDSCMDTIFKQMKRKLMHLVESGRGGDETGHGLAHLGDPVDREQLYKSSNDTKRIPSSSINSRTHLSDLNASNQSYQGGLNDLVYYGQQLYQSSNLILTTSTNQTHVPENVTSNQFHDDDEITVKNELGEIVVNIIPNESFPTSSIQSQPSNNEQSNENIDDLFEEDEEEDCDCPECVGDAFVKMEEGDDEQEEEDDDDDVQLIENLDENDESSSRTAKRPRHENNQAQLLNQNTSNQFITISLKCSQCSQMFQDKYALNVHLKSQHSIEKYRCLYKDCNLSFNIKSHLVDHYKTTHKTQPATMWPCGYCSAQLKNSHSLLSHYLQQHEEGVFRCSYPECQFVGKLKQTVINHFRTLHKSHICHHPDCAKRYASVSKLKAHERTHRDAKPYRCRWLDCQHASAYMSNIMHHIRAHLARNQDGVHSTDPKDYIEVLHNLV